MNLETNSQFGQYRILRLLGRGGMGEVYEVQHLTLGRVYALKLLPPEFDKQPDAIARFRREARVMANLEHPHIVRVDDFGETEGRYWLRMELVKGVRSAECGVENGPVGRHCITLGDYAAARGGRIEQAEFALLLRQILEALAYAHEAGVVHRDLKPGNILLDRDAGGGMAVRVADFGLARVVGDEFLRSQAQLNVSRNLSLGQAATLAVEPGRGAAAGSEEEGTSTRALVGTWEYMSPEQKRGEEADARSDVFAVGLICYRLLTGKGLGLKLPSELVPGVDPQWDRFVAGAVEQDRAARYANGREMLAAAAPLLELVQGMAEQRTAEDRQRAEAEAAQRALEQEQRAAAAEARAQEAEERRLRAAREQERRKQLEQLRIEAQRRNEERMDRVALQWAKLRLLPWSWVVLGVAVLAFALTIWRSSPTLWPAVVVMLLGVVAARVTCGPKWPAGVAAALGLVMAAAAVYPRFAQRGLHFAKGGLPARPQPTAGAAQATSRTAGSPARLTSASKWHLSFRSRRYERSIGDRADLAFVPGGRYLAVASDISIELWDPERPVLYRTLPDWRGRSGSVSIGERGNYRQLSLASGGTLLACALGSYSAMEAGLFDLRTGEIVRTFARDEKETEVVGLALSADGQHLACTYKSYSGGNGYIKLWNARTGELRRYLGTVAPASSGQSPPPVAAPPPTPADAFAQRYGKSSRTPPSASRQKSASPSSPRPMTYSSESVKEEAMALAFAPDGKTLACSYKISSGGGFIRLWNVEDGKVVRQTYTLPTQGGGNEFQRRYGLSGVGGGDEWVAALKFAPDGTTLACGYANCGSQVRFAEVRLWDTAQPNSKPVPVLRSSQAGAHTEVTPNALDISPDGKYLACSFKRASAPWEVRVFDLRMNAPLATLTDATGGLTQSSPKSVSGIAFSPDGGSLAVGLEQQHGQNDVLFEFRETRTGRVLRQVAKNDLHRSSAVRALAVSPDGLTLACGFSGPASRAEIILVQPGYGAQPRQVPDASDNPVNFNRLEFNSALAFLPGSSKLVAGYEGPDSDGALKIWDAKTGTLDRTLPCPTGEAGKRSNHWSVVSLSAAPDAKTLLCLCRDAESRLEARLWALEQATVSSQTPLEVFPPDAIVFTAFSSRGQPLCCAYGGSDAAGRLKLTDPKTGKLVQTFETAPGEYDAAWMPAAAALAPDGITLVCAYAKAGEHAGLQHLVLWDASGKELRKVAEENIYSSEGPVTAVCFYDNGASIACGAGDGDIKQWDIKPTGSGAARR